MNVAKSLFRLVGVPCLLGLMALGSASAQPAVDYQPTVGQRGKDVVWVPTAEALVETMLDMANVTSADYLIDLGSGDGRTVIAAAKRGAKATGIEYDPAMVALSIRNAINEGVSDRANFVEADLFESDFSQATVLTMFLLPDINLRLRPKILDMKPGTRVVSNTFTMGDWTADQTFQSPAECKAFCRAYFWIVPAKVGGKWKSQNGELALEQKFQTVSGTMTSDGVTTPIVNGRLKGDVITFTAGERTYAGRVTGEVIEGTSESGYSKAEWRVTRG